MQTKLTAIYMTQYPHTREGKGQGERWRDICILTILFFFLVKLSKLTQSMYRKRCIWQTLGTDCHDKDSIGGNNKLICGIESLNGPFSHLVGFRIQDLVQNHPARSFLPHGSTSPRAQSQRFHNISRQFSQFQTTGTVGDITPPS